MSCHWSRAAPGPPRDAEGGRPLTGTAAVYGELARAGRREDFRWFALSQGVAREMVDELWRDTRLMVGAERPRVGG